MLRMEQITTKINFSKIWRNTNVHFYMEKAHDTLLIRTSQSSVNIRCQLFIRPMNGIEIELAFVCMMMNKTVILTILFKYSAELVNSKFVRRLFKEFWDLMILDNKWNLVLISSIVTIFVFEKSIWTSPSVASWAKADGQTHIFSCSLTYFFSIEIFLVKLRYFLIWKK